MKNQNIMFVTVVLGVVCLGHAPIAQAVGPDTEGAIAGANNGEGVGVLVNRTTGVWNTGTGFEALNHLTAGNQNTATGFRSLANDTNGGFNTATGVFSLFSNTIGFFNTATGAYSLANNTDGNQNTANGYGALYFNTEGDSNTAAGFGALYKNTIGFGNTANGYLALNRNTTGSQNTANGYQALYSNTTGILNTANGYLALNRNSTGSFNMANGYQALYNNTTGVSNTALGDSALYQNTSGNYNTANGFQALSSNTTGVSNTALGDSAGFNVTTADDVICIGANVGGENVSNSCYIGNIFGVTSPGGASVFVNSLGKLGTATSSRRFKEEIKLMDQASEALFALKPVTFRYKKELDSQGIRQFGLVAEEVEKVNPNLVVRDAEGKVNTVRYDQVNAMLLNEFLKEHHTVQELKSTVARQQKQIDMLTAGLQKVSAQLELSRPAPRTAVKNR